MYFLKFIPIFGNTVHRSILDHLNPSPPEHTKFLLYAVCIAKLHYLGIKRNFIP